MMARLLIALCLVCLVACGGAKAPKSSPPPPSKPKPAAKKEAEEAEGELVVVEEYVYSPVGKRDPFRTFLDRLAPANDAPADPLCGQLCTWDLEQLRLVAVVSGLATPLAMVQDPKGDGFNIRRGASIGKRNGKVTEILRDRIIVTEYQRLGTGEMVPTETEILLRSGNDASDPEPLNHLVAEDG